MKTAVLMIDLQNAYFEDPALASRQETVVEAANLLIRTATAAQVPVLLVYTQHLRDRSTWTLSMLDDDQGFLFEGSEQAEFLPGLQTEGLERIVKTRDSAFFGTNLAERLRERRGTPGTGRCRHPQLRCADGSRCVRPQLPRGLRQGRHCLDE